MNAYPALSYDEDGDARPAAIVYPARLLRFLRRMIPGAVAFDQRASGEVTNLLRGRSCRGCEVTEASAPELLKAKKSDRILPQDLHVCMINTVIATSPGESVSRFQEFLVSFPACIIPQSSMIHTLRCCDLG